MTITVDGEDVFERWMREGTTLKAEVVFGHIGVTFTGRVARVRPTELVLVRGEDEMSISTFFARIRLLASPSGSLDAQKDFAQKYVRVVQITTDAGVCCTILELRDHNLNDPS